MKETFQAIHSSELDGFFSRLGLLENFKAGKLNCAACGETITRDNFRIVTKRRGVILFACAKDACLSTFFNK